MARWAWPLHSGRPRASALWKVVSVQYRVVHSTWGLLSCWYHRSQSGPNQDLHNGLCTNRIFNMQFTNRHYTQTSGSFHYHTATLLTGSNLITGRFLSTFCHTPKYNITQGVELISLENCNSHSLIISLHKGYWKPHTEPQRSQFDLSTSAKAPCWPETSSFTLREEEAWPRIAFEFTNLQTTVIPTARHTYVLNLP